MNLALVDREGQILEYSLIVDRDSEIFDFERIHRFYWFKLMWTKTQGRHLPAAPDFLSNLGLDVTETKNLAPQHPDVVKRLTRLHKYWTQEVETQ